MRRRYAPSTESEAPASPFANAEHAWFWFARCHRVRREGARLEKGANSVQRPCHPDDIYRAAVGLFRDGAIGRLHLKVLATYGLAERPPDPRCSNETLGYRLWHEALDRLTTVLQTKGIVE